MGRCLFMRKGETHSVPINGILASTLSVGSTVRLLENGSPVEYLVVNQGIPSNSSLYDSSCNGTWLLRKDCLYNGAWDSDGFNNYYTSNIHPYLNETFISTFDSDTQAAIISAKIPYAANNNTVWTGTSGLDTKAFILSARETGLSNSTYMQVDGVKLDYFSDTETRIANYNGSAVTWWTRTRRNSHTSRVWAITSTGESDYLTSSTGTTYYIRPALILPFNALFDKKTLLLKGVA